MFNVDHFDVSVIINSVFPSTSSALVQRPGPANNNTRMRIQGDVISFGDISTSMHNRDKHYVVCNHEQ